MIVLIEVLQKLSDGLQIEQMHYDVFLLRSSF